MGVSKASHSCNRRAQHGRRASRHPLHGICLVLGLACGLVGYNATAQPSWTWMQTAGPYAQRADILAALPDGTLFAKADFRLYRSDDGGGSWTKYHSGLPATLWGLAEFARGPGSTLLLATSASFGENSDLYLSTNGGDTWVQIPAQGDVGSLAVSAGGTLLVGVDYRGIFRSTDRGQQWDQVLTLSSLDRVILQSSETGTVLAGTRYGIYRSEDDGLTWHDTGWNGQFANVWALALGEGGRAYAALVTDISNEVYFSEDDGRQWTRVKVIPGRVSALAYHPDGYLFIGSASGLWRADDRGGNWVKVRDEVHSGTSLVVTQDGSLIAGSPLSGLMRSRDQGATWSPTGVPSTNALSLAVHPEGYVFAGTSYEDDGCVFRTADRGASWQRSELCNTTLRALITTGQGHLFAGSNEKGSFEGPRIGIFRSLDAGEVWTYGGAVEEVRAITVLSGFGQDVAFIGTASGVLRSDDGMAPWLPLNTGLPELDVWSLAAHYDVDLRDTLLFAGTAENGVFRRIIGDPAWVPTSLQSGKAHLLKVHENTLFAGTDDGLFRSGDAGTTWETLLGGETVYALAVAPDGALFAGTDGGVRWLAPGEASWQEANTGLLERTVRSLAIDDAGYLYAGTLGGGVFRSSGSLVVGNEDTAVVAGSFSLEQNYPNPFNGATRIDYTLAVASEVEWTVYDVLGREVWHRPEGFRSAGRHSLTLEAANLPSGLYLYRLTAGPHTEARTMLVLK